jgi:hypothetical protein
MLLLKVRGHVSRPFIENLMFWRAERMRTVSELNKNRRKSSSGIWCRVVVVGTHVSEERIASIFRAGESRRESINKNHFRNENFNMNAISINRPDQRV